MQQIPERTEAIKLIEKITDNNVDETSIALIKPDGSVSAIAFAAGLAGFAFIITGFVGGLGLFAALMTLFGLTYGLSGLTLAALGALGSLVAVGLFIVAARADNQLRAREAAQRIQQWMQTPRYRIASVPNEAGVFLSVEDELTKETIYERELLFTDDTFEDAIELQADLISKYGSIIIADDPAAVLQCVHQQRAADPALPAAAQEQQDAIFQLNDVLVSQRSAQ